MVDSFEKKANSIMQKALVGMSNSSLHAMVHIFNVNINPMYSHMPS